MSRRYHSGASGLFFGAIVVAVGCLLLLDNLGIVRFHDVWQYWPVLLVAWGVSRVVDSRTPSGWIWGGMIALVGAFLLLDNLDIIVFNFAVVWPILLIAFGVSVLVRALEPKSRCAEGLRLRARPSLGRTQSSARTGAAAIPRIFKAEKRQPFSAPRVSTCEMPP